MKTLYVMRHAKSSWDYPELSDYERPLNKRGKRDAPRMAKWLSQQEELPQTIITSGANRAFTLAKVVHEKLCCELQINDDLYGVGTRELLQIIRNFDDSYECLMIVGHNPELTAFINHYGSMNLLNLPTSGLVRIRFNADHWSTVHKGQADLHMWPKLLD